MQLYKPHNLCLNSICLVQAHKNLKSWMAEECDDKVNQVSQRILKYIICPKYSCTIPCFSILQFQSKSQSYCHTVKEAEKRKKKKNLLRLREMEVDDVLLRSAAWRSTLVDGVLLRQTHGQSCKKAMGSSSLWERKSELRLREGKGSCPSSTHKKHVLQILNK